MLVRTIDITKKYGMYDLLQYNLKIFGLEIAEAKKDVTDDEPPQR